MVPQRILAVVIAVIQFLLGVALFFLPDLFFAAFGFSPAANDQKYLFGQLAARFVALGFGMLYVARTLPRSGFWWDVMLLIQVLDLAVGLFYSLFGGVSWAVTGFPVFNAAVLAGLLAWGRTGLRALCDAQTRATNAA